MIFPPEIEEFLQKYDFGIGGVICFQLPRPYQSVNNYLQDY